jgi:hypothetical protein
MGDSLQLTSRADQAEKPLVRPPVRSAVHRSSLEDLFAIGRGAAAPPLPDAHPDVATLERQSWTAVAGALEQAMQA